MNKRIRSLVIASETKENRENVRQKMRKLHSWTSGREEDERCQKNKLPVGVGTFRLENVHLNLTIYFI